MKKILLLISLFLFGHINANPIWTIYDIKVDSPEAAANVVAATDELMASNFAKENFKGSLHLNAYLANGDNEATHFFAVLQPSLTEHANWMTASQQSTAGQKFFKSLRENSTNVSEQLNSFVQTYGNPSNEDIYWIIHEFNAAPSDLPKIVKAFERVDEETRGDFPGQFGLSSVAFGADETTHLLTVGYKSIAELEAWEDQISTNKAVLRFQKTLDGMVKWTGSRLLFNARVYDSASDLEQFVTKDFE